LIPAESYLSRIIEPPNVLLANINRSVITENLNHWLSIVNPETKILLSGFLIDDEELIESLAAQHKLVRTMRKEKNGWLALSFVHVA
ncbi:MAG: 50S ribosomal protein L11 methyltransferase, partial [Chitinophagales bacterium]|nr:50S ribosomal protein L11 methyltransferase [Chitinophagales bacterium]